jgi:hypothetical protein
MERSLHSHPNWSYGGNNSDMVIESVGLWHQLLRQPALDLRRGIGESVEISFTTENIRNPELLLAEEAA